MKRFLPTLKILATLAAVVFIVLAIAHYAREIRDLALQLHAVPLLFGLILTILATLPLSLLWATVVRPGSTTNPQLNLAYTKANLVRYIPGNVFGLGARVYYALTLGITKSVATASLLTEGVLLLAASGALAILHLRPALGAVALIAAPLGVGLLARLLRDRPSVPTPGHAGLLTIGAFSYCVGLGLALATLASAVGLAIPVRTAIGVFGLAWFLGYVSLLTPSGLGVREGAIVVALTPLIGAPAATFLSIASRLAIVIAELLVAAGWWVLARRRRPAETSTLG